MRVLFSEIRYVKYAYFTISYNVRSNYGLNLLFAEHCGCSVGYYLIASTLELLLLLLISTTLHGNLCGIA